MVGVIGGDRGLSLFFPVERSGRGDRVDFAEAYRKLPQELPIAQCQQSALGCGRENERLESQAGTFDQFAQNRLGCADRLAGLNNVGLGGGDHQSVGGFDESELWLRLGAGVATQSSIASTAAAISEIPLMAASFLSPNQADIGRLRVTRSPRLAIGFFIIQVDFALST
jgi:hypothetical protein